MQEWLQASGSPIIFCRNKLKKKAYNKYWERDVDISRAENYNNNVFNDAGWSSLEARRAHNPKVICSNPVPATYAQIAQLVEQRTENPRVTGSILVLGITIS